MPDGYLPGLRHRFYSRNTSVILKKAIWAAVFVLFSVLLWNGIVSPVFRESRPIVNVAPQLVSLKGLPTKGTSSAAVVIVEYGDFGSQGCVRFFRDTLPLLYREYIERGIVRLAFNQTVSHNNNKAATDAAHAAACALDQRRFWEMHDALFTRFDSIASPGEIIRLASIHGLDVHAFQRCLDGSARASVEAFRVRAQWEGVTRTPTPLVGEAMPNDRLMARTRIDGSAHIGSFRIAINHILAVNARATASGRRAR